MGKNCIYIQGLITGIILDFFSSCHIPDGILLFKCNVLLNCDKIRHENQLLIESF